MYTSHLATTNQQSVSDTPGRAQELDGFEGEFDEDGAPAEAAKKEDPNAIDPLAVIDWREVRPVRGARFCAWRILSRLRPLSVRESPLFAHGERCEADEKGRRICKHNHSGSVAVCNTGGDLRDLDGRVHATNYCFERP